jgi:hypothetical protein
VDTRQKHFGYDGINIQTKVFYSAKINFDVSTRLCLLGSKNNAVIPNSFKTKRDSSATAPYQHQLNGFVQGRNGSSLHAFLYHFARCCAMLGLLRRIFIQSYAQKTLDIGRLR